MHKIIQISETLELSLFNIKFSMINMKNVKKRGAYRGICIVLIKDLFLFKDMYINGIKYLFSEK